MNNKELIAHSKFVRKAYENLDRLNKFKGFGKKCDLTMTNKETAESPYRTNFCSTKSLIEQAKAIIKKGPIGSRERNENRFKVKDCPYKIASMNVRGVNNKKKSIECILDEQDIDILVISEIATRNMPHFKGYTKFVNYKKKHKHMHGVAILVKNSMSKHVLRIPDESDLEIIHIRIENTIPAVNIIGTYLDVENKLTREELSNIWSLYTGKVNTVLDRGESVMCLGDFNRPLQTKKPTFGTKLLWDWLKDDRMSLINDKTVNTRLNPADNTGSVLDLALISEDMKNRVKNFIVDSERKMTAFSMTKRNKKVIKKYTDHYTILVEANFPTKLKNGRKTKKPIINLSNQDGWNKYHEVSEKHSHRIRKVIENTDDPNLLESKLGIIDTDIQIESFGIIWVGKCNKSRKAKKKNSKELNTMYQEYLEEIDSAVNECLDRKDIHSRMYKMKSLISGPKIKSQEQSAINHPETNELITEEEQIKQVSLDHNIKILTKTKPLPKYEHIIEEKRNEHRLMMERNQEGDDWSLDRLLFEKVLKRIKEKNKKMFYLFNRAGPTYKEAIFLLMKRLIQREEVPKAYDFTTLSQIWKKKGSPLSLDNMRFVHMKCWRAKLLEALITEKMKPKIVASTPNIQIGGIPSHQSVEHLVTLKTWMKKIEENNEAGILSLYDMAKFFDKESLLDCMNTLNKKAQIDAKSYRMWYKLNENTKISVKTSVGESKTAPIKDSVGQGSFGAGLVSSLNIGCAVDDLFRGLCTATIGLLILVCLILQDDIMQMSTTANQARDGCQRIDEMLKEKQLSVNYSKTKYIILGKGYSRSKIVKDFKKTPMKMGETIIENSVSEDYLGDGIHEKGCEESITITINKRIRKLISKTEEIIQISNTTIMMGLKNSRIALNLFEAIIILALLHNSESWIGLGKKHIDVLQKFQDKFLRRIFHAPGSITRALLEYDTGMRPIEWRIKERKLNFVRQILLKDDSNIAKNAILQEMEVGINGLGHECNSICNEINIPEVMTTSLLKSNIKTAVQQTVSARARENMLSFRKVADRVSDNPSDNSYINRMGLAYSRTWIRYRARAIKGVKANCKRSWINDLNCRFCKDNILENQEHLEECAGLWFERRNLNMDTAKGKIVFFRRAKEKLEGRS